MMSQDENVAKVNEFLERGECQVLLVCLGATGQLQPLTKACKLKTHFQNHLVFLIANEWSFMHAFM